MKYSKFSIVSLLLATTGSASVFHFSSTNNPAEICMGLRQAGNPSEIVIDLGAYTQFRGLTPGSTFTVTNISPAKIREQFPNLDDLAFAAFGAIRLRSSTNPPYKTTFLTRARADISIQSTPISRGNSAAQGAAATQIIGVGDDARFYSLSQPDGPSNNGQLVVIPIDLPNLNYSQHIGDGTFNGTVESTIETFLPTNFVTNGQPARADLYEVQPEPGLGGSPAIYLGYFDFLPDAQIRFTAAGGTVTPGLPPSIVSESLDATTFSVSFTSEAGNYQYQLLRAPKEDPRKPVTEWEVRGTAVTGTGGTLTLSDTVDADAAHYRVRVTP